MQKNWVNGIKIVGIAVAVYLGMKYVLPAVIPFFIAWLLVKLVLPAADFFYRKYHLSRVLSGGFLLMLLLGVLAVLIYILGSQLWRQICNLAANLDGYALQTERFISDCCRMVEEKTGIHAQQMEQFVYQNFQVLEESVKSYSVPGMLKNSLSYMMGFFRWLGVFLVMFISVVLLLKDYDEIRRRLNEYPFFEQTSRILKAMQNLGGAWLKAQITIILIVMTVCVAGLWLLRYPYALLMGILIGLLDALPFIGTGTVLVPWALYLIFTGQAAYGICLGVLFLATNMLREYLEPKLIGDKIGVYPIVMVITVYLGLRIYGISGVILGPVSYLLIEEIYREMNPSSSRE